jgi:hypothetical protein
MTDKPSQPAGETGLFVYAIVPSDVEPTGDAEGIGSPPSQVTTIRQGKLAALVSEIDLAQPLGRPADLMAYQRLLDATAAVAPVVPVRFGAVLGDAGAVRDLLDAHQDRFATALGELESRVQYTVRGRFDEAEFIGALLERDAAVAALADQIRGRPEPECRQQRIQFGELVNRAVERSRDAETQELIDAVGPHAVTHAAGPPSHELDAMNVSFLVDLDNEEEFVQAVRDFAEQRRNLVQMRLLGPLAPYDFVSAQQLVG